LATGPTPSIKSTPFAEVLPLGHLLALEVSLPLLFYSFGSSNFGKFLVLWFCLFPFAAKRGMLFPMSVSLKNFFFSHTYVQTSLREPGFDFSLRSFTAPCGLTPHGTVINAARTPSEPPGFLTRLGVSLPASSATRAKGIKGGAEGVPLLLYDLFIVLFASFVRLVPGCRSGQTSIFRSVFSPKLILQMDCKPRVVFKTSRRTSDPRTP